ncbi:NADH-quinone oxidoreductase subunit N [Bailinhaonella thermotolerans]|uniref:NADH-quinone oxidoreductase subunit N n=1 Tax=Bailinhaonella thermotolerans TaxID=1070861 RepID=A0A3A4A9L6_9ACTN|nr:proton-conducting transporter membrane subunit [Bailinhaonella thermotolerans]RJL24841.1 NADH-quinone oxidoreductase subunit N [Bailinhaonella thermotolerans]
MTENPLDLLPELLVLAGAVAGLLTGSFLARERQRAVAWICGLALAAALAATGLAAGRPDGMAFGAYALDPITHTARAVVAGSTLLVLVLAAPWARGNRRESELYALCLLAALGSIALAGADDLLVLVAAYLLAGVPGYALAGFARDARGTEAALKYYLMGAFLGVLMLAGVTLLYGLSGVTAYRDLAGRLGQAPAAAVGCGLVLLLAGPLTKAGAVPAQFWVPDAAQGASRPVAAFLTTVPKIGAFAALYRLAAEPFAGIEGWRVALALVAAATMTLGNLAAFRQDDARRLLAYSTIGQAGYILVPVAAGGPLSAPALLFYLAAYAVTNVGAFAVVVAVGRDRLADHAGLARRAPALALALAVCLLGLVGTPPTAVFAAKVLVIASAWESGLAWLAVLLVLNTVASLFYYLRWLTPAFRAAPAAPPGPARSLEDPGRSPRPAAGPYGVAVLAAAASVLLGVGAGLFLA